VVRDSDCMEVIIKGMCVISTSNTEEKNVIKPHPGKPLFFSQQ